MPSKSLVRLWLVSSLLPLLLPLWHIPVFAETALDKIAFDLSPISSEGLVGSGGNVRSLRYEFCIPATETALTEVLAIDPTLHYFEHSRGRIGCTGEQRLVIGSTHQPQWREILVQIARLEYVDRIEEFVGE